MEWQRRNKQCPHCRAHFPNNEVSNTFVSVPFVADIVQDFNTSKCPKHAEPFCYYCKSCDGEMCADCIVMKSSDSADPKCAHWNDSRLLMKWREYFSDQKQLLRKEIHLAKGRLSESSPAFQAPNDLQDKLEFEADYLCQLVWEELDDAKKGRKDNNKYNREKLDVLRVMELLYFSTNSDNNRNSNGSKKNSSSSQFEFKGIKEIKEQISIVKAVSKRDFCQRNPLDHLIPPEDTFYVCLEGNKMLNKFSISSIIYPGHTWTITLERYHNSGLVGVYLGWKHPATATGATKSSASAQSIDYNKRPIKLDVLVARGNSKQRVSVSLYVNGDTDGYSHLLNVGILRPDDSVDIKLVIRTSSYVYHNYLLYGANWINSYVAQ